MLRYFVVVQVLHARRHWAVVGQTRLHHTCRCTCKLGELLDATPPPLPAFERSDRFKEPAFITTGPGCA